MTDCNFKTTKLPNGQYLQQCKRPGCTHGDRILKTEILHRNCNGYDGVQKVGIAKKVVRFATALARWIAAGRPVRQPEEIDRIYHEHCKPCVHFDGDKQTCRICGCNCRDHEALLNKIKWATENCPLEKWSSPTVMPRKRLELPHRVRAGRAVGTSAPKQE